MVFPLEGIRILDSAHQYPGPYCSLLLGDLGADIIKIERPDGGDPARFAVNFFRSLNRNKKSLTLNLKAPDAREIIYQLVKQHDVFTEGFRPGVAKRLGIDYETLSKINPSLVYCSISGYGQDGPYRDLPGHDLNYQAMSGMMEAFKDKDGNYVPPGVAVGDLSSGMFAAIGIMAALMAREKTGEGAYVDVSMSDGLLSWMATAIASATPIAGAGDSSRGASDGPRSVGGDAGYGIFMSGDEKYFTLGIAHEDWFWKRLCAATGLDEYKNLNGLERRMRRAELVAKLHQFFSSRSRDECVKLLMDADVPVFPVQTPAEIPDDPHVKFREMIQDITLKSGEKSRQVSFPVQISDMSRKVRLPPPELGEHTDQILNDLGYSESEITQFRNGNII